MPGVLGQAQTARASEDASAMHKGRPCPLSQPSVAFADLSRSALRQGTACGRAYHSARHEEVAAGGL